MQDEHDPSASSTPALEDRETTLWKGLCWIFCGVALVLSFARLFYGVDLVDEATHVAIPYRFWLGDTPFVDEHSAIQTSSLLALPFVELYCRINGGNEGLVLFVRVVYFAFCCVTAAAVAFGVAPWIGARRAAIVGTACVAFCPLGMPTLSYNTWSIGFFTIGVFVGLQSLLWSRRAAWLGLAGVAHGFASVALPTYALPGLVYAVGIWLSAPRERRMRSVSLYAAGGAAACTLLAPWLYRFDAETIQNAYRHVHPDGGWTVRVRQFVDQNSFLYAFRWELAIALFAVWIGRRRGLAWLTGIAIAFLPLFPLVSSRQGKSVWYIALLAGVGIVLFLFAWRATLSKRLLWLVVLPSACAGVVATVTSAVGLFNLGCGLFSVALIGMTLAVVLTHGEARKTSSRWLESIDVAYPLLAVAMLLGYQLQPFGDDPVRTLDTRVTSGPYRGLYTWAGKEQYLRETTRDLDAIATGRDRIVFLDHFPAGYLLTDLRPGVDRIWTDECTGGVEGECEREMRDNLERNGGSSLVAVRMRSFPLRRTNRWERLPNAIDALLEERYTLALDRPGYSIFVSKTDTR